MKPEKALEIVKAIRPNAAAPREPSHTKLTSDRADASGFVYFVYCAGRIKIGFTTDVVARMLSLATASPFPISLLMTLPGNPEDEAAFHAAFDHSRANLEWFTLSDDLRDFIESRLCADGMTIFTNTQFEARGHLAECFANVVYHTGGDDGCDVVAAAWPNALQPAP